jgi:CRP-like cAMP-binding protein
MVEVGTVGNEGMVGLPLALGGSEMVSQALMQVPRVRIARDAFARALSQSPTLHQRLMRYTLALLAQISLSVACNRAHSVEQRCARWLLMTHDRVGDSTFPLTQEFLAQMLGVRRPTVSLAAGMLQKADLITYARGKMTILSRAGLEQLSCECYRAMVDEYKKAFK